MSISFVAYGVTDVSYQRYVVASAVPEVLPHEIMFCPSKCALFVVVSVPRTIVTALPTAFCHGVKAFDAIVATLLAPTKLGALSGLRRYVHTEGRIHPPAGTTALESVSDKPHTSTGGCGVGLPVPLGLP